MPRLQKNNLEYFPVDVNLFSDIKIRKLMKKFPTGITVYFFLLSKIYSVDNAEMNFCNDDLEIYAEDCRLDFEDFVKILNFCVEIGLFSKTHYSENILTSNGIKKRFQFVMNERLRKRGSRKNESDGQTADIQRTNDGQTADMVTERERERERERKKESKIKGEREGKGKESDFPPNPTQAPDTFFFSTQEGLHLSRSEIESYQADYPQLDIGERFAKYEKWLQSIENKPNNVIFKNKIKIWLDDDNSKANTRQSIASDAKGSTNGTNGKFDVKKFLESQGIESG